MGGTGLTRDSCVLSRTSICGTAAEHLHPGERGMELLFLASINALILRVIRLVDPEDADISWHVVSGDRLAERALLEESQHGCEELRFHWSLVCDR